MIFIFYVIMRFFETYGHMFVKIKGIKNDTYFVKYKSNFKFMVRYKNIPFLKRYPYTNKGDT